MIEDVIPEHYRDRKEHGCGCITLWDNWGTGVRYESTCGLHRYHGAKWPVVAES